MATKAEVKLPPSTPLSLNWLLQTQQAVKTNKVESAGEEHVGGHGTSPQGAQRQLRSRVGPSLRLWLLLLLFLLLLFLLFMLWIVVVLVRRHRKGKQAEKAGKQKSSEAKTQKQNREAEKPKSIEAQEQAESSTVETENLKK